VEKITATGDPGQILGVVNERGHYIQNPRAVLAEGDANFINRCIAEKFRSLRDRRKLYSPDRGAISAKDKKVILIDIGIDTGLSMQALIHACRQDGAERVIVAAAVGRPQAVMELKPLAEQIEVLCRPDSFTRIGDYFQKFEPVNDRDVCRILAQWSRLNMLRSKFT
jgi:predicted phosphoribosyltransferase